MRDVSRRGYITDARRIVNRSNDMAKKAETKKAQNRIWIELERPTTKEQGEERARLATTMLRRLGVQQKSIFWDGHEGRYCYGDAMGYLTLSDDGHWFNLDYLGGSESEVPADITAAINADLQQDAQDFATLQAKM